MPLFAVAAHCTGAGVLLPLSSVSMQRQASVWAVPPHTRAQVWLARHFDGVCQGVRRGHYHDTCCLDIRCEGARLDGAVVMSCCLRGHDDSGYACLPPGLVGRSRWTSHGRWWCQRVGVGRLPVCVCVIGRAGVVLFHQSRVC
jgi:hypothetical protein